MKTILILAEGQTEDVFIRTVLAPHLRSMGVEPISKVAVTKRTLSGSQHQGGLGSYAKVARDIRKLLDDSSAALITTMLDFYGLPPDFPGKTTLPSGSCYQRVEHLERELEKRIDHRRFTAYLALHEFEALLFAAPERLATFFPSPSIALRLKEIRDRFSSPEEINEGIQTAPSKRIRGLFSGYQKPLHGPQAVARIGLDALRTQCRHFATWLARLESVGRSSAPS